MGKRSADSVMFGFDFQVNAAIVLMLEDIKGLRSIRLEGNYEDIELSYDNGEHVLAQAKSITDPINDFSNVHSNLKKALKTLSEGKEKGKVRRLIFITNSRNPFKEKINIGSFEGESKRPYSSLSKKAQDLVDNYLKDIENPLDKDKFLVHILPFETDIDEERYKIVKNRIDEFLSDLNLSSSGIGKKVMKVWQTDIFNNGTKKNKKIELTKSKIIWPIIYIVTDIKRYEDNILEIIDESIYDDVLHRYDDLIETYTERISFFIKVIYDYSDFKSEKNRSKKLLDFIESNWENYKSDFSLSDEDSELEKALIQVILYTILKNKLNIKRIKDGVNL